MLASIKRRASHVNLEHAKFLFTVRVTQIVIADSSAIESGSILTVCFEKGGKISTSNQFVFDWSQNDVNPISAHENLSYVTIPTDERLELVVTLYRTAAGQKFQPKEARLILRQLKRNPTLGMDAFKSIGAVDLSLHTLVQQMGDQRSLTLEMQPQFASLPGSSLHVTITVRPVRDMLSKQKRASITSLSFGRLGSGKTENEEADESRSTGSADSDHSHFSAVGATFYYDDLDPYAGAMDDVVSTLGVVRSSLGGEATLSPSRSTRSGRPSLGAGDMDAVFTEGASMRSVGGAQRRRSSGMHVMEVALQENHSERTNSKPLAQRPSITRPPTVAAATTTGTTSTTEGVDDPPPPSLADKYAAEADAGAEATPTEPSAAVHMAESYNAPSAASPAPAQLHTPAARTPRTRGNSQASMSTSRQSLHDDWEPVLASDENDGDARRSMTQLSPMGSPQYASTGRKSLLHKASFRGTPVTSPVPAGAVPMQVQEALLSDHDEEDVERHGPEPTNRNDETFAAYEREMQAQAVRIAELEQRLAESAAQYRVEAAENTAALRSAEAELALLRPAHLQHTARSAVLCAQCGGVVDAPVSASEAAQEAPTPVLIHEPVNADEQPEDEGSAHAPDTPDVPELPERTEDERPESVEAIQPRQSMFAAPEPEEYEEYEGAEPSASTVTSTHASSAPAAVVAPLPAAATTSAPHNAAAIASLVSEYGRTSAEVKLLAQELVYYKQLAADAQRAKAEETMASREAATVAVQACMRRADCEQELLDAMSVIQDLYRRVNLLQIEFDGEVRRNYALKSRMQLYAQKMSAMEVDYSLSLCQLEDEGLLDELAQLRSPPPRANEGDDEV